MSNKELAMKALSDARARLVLKRDATSVFFATLALRLQPVVTDEFPTAATDGKHLFVNPDWWLSLDDKTRIGVVAHEVMHPAMQHHTRRMGRDPRKWNIAADAAINPLLRDAGFSLPSEGIFPGKDPLKNAPDGLSSEEYYNLIEEVPPDYQGFGEVVDGWGDEASRAKSEADWKVNVAAARDTAKKRGQLPGGIDRLVDDVLESKVDWKTALAEFIKATARSDYRWCPPNRRFVHAGIYLPSIGCESIGEVVIAVDTSGSIDDEMLAQFAGECQAVFDCYTCKIHIVYCDCAVNHVEEWSPGDGDIHMRSVGGGGTDHAPVWEWLAESEVDPSCVICLTDGYTNFGEDPGVPVLWALTEKDMEVPFGKTIMIHKEVFA